MSSNVAAFFDTWETDVEAMKREAPHIAKAFGGLFGQLMKPGALTTREKELVALGMGLALRCGPCINLHVEKCLKAGATREEILEVAGVLVMMQGGPGFTYVPEVIRALDHLEPKQQPPAGDGG